MAQEGLLTKIIAAGVNIAEPTCDACIGTGHVPAPGTKSLRAINSDILSVNDIFKGISEGKLTIYNKVKGYSFKVKMNLTERQKKILKAGGRLILARNQEV